MHGVLGDHVTKGVDLVAQSHIMLCDLLMARVVGELHVINTGGEGTHDVSLFGLLSVLYLVFSVL